MQQFFRRLAHATAEAVGTPWTFLAALAVVIAWAASGVAFHYSDTRQLVINSGTTIVTFLIVFLIQSTQNRDAKVMQLKLDELIRATHTARNRLLDMEAMSDDELGALHGEFKELHRRTAEALEDRRQHDRRISPTGILSRMPFESGTAEQVSEAAAVTTAAVLAGKPSGRD